MQENVRLPEHLWLWVLVVITALTSAAAFVLGFGAGIDAFEVYLTYIDRIFELGTTMLIVAAFTTTVLLLLQGDRKPLDTFGAFFASRMSSGSSIAAVVAPSLLIPLLMGGFGVLKQLIPHYFPFSWDDTFAHVGYYMLLGHSPWRITHALFGSPLATYLLDRLYIAWVPIMFLTIPAVGLVAPPLLRARFFLSLTLGFVLIGLLGAFFLSSAGPCFAGLLGTSTAPRYVELMARLHAINDSGYHLIALDLQDQLWRAYRTGSYGFGMGISAMPSMHNALALLYALAARKADRKLGWLASVFAVLIFIGSVHLGWHYTADGIVAWAAMGSIWWLSGWYLRATGYERAVNTATAPQLILVVDNAERLAA